MNEITEKLHNEAMSRFDPVAEEMARSGADMDSIVSVFQSHMRVKTSNLYTGRGEPVPIEIVLRNLPIKNIANSRTKFILYRMLKDRNLKIEFQYQIGPYRVDYLLNNFLVVELNHPQHKKSKDDFRNGYLRKLGYEIIHVPLWILQMDTRSVVEEIQKAVEFHAGRKGGWNSERSDRTNGSNR